MPRVARTSGWTGPVSEQRAFLRDAINVRRLVAHHALVVGAEVPIADVVPSIDKDVGFLWVCGVDNTGGH